MEYNMPWFATPGPAPYLLTTDINDVMLSNVLDAPLLSDAPRSVSLMGGAGGGGGDQTAPPDLAATVPQEFAEWGYQEYTGYDSELKQDDMEMDQEEELGPSGDGKRKHQHNAKKPKVHLDPKLKLKGPITYEKDVDPSLIPIVRDGMARCEKCGALGVRHAFYTRERRYCSLTCARSGEGLPTDESSPGTPEDPSSSSSANHLPPESPGGESATSAEDNIPCGAAPRIDAAVGAYSWDTLMTRTLPGGESFNAAPVQCFAHAPMVNSWETVCVGLKVEVTCEPSPPSPDPTSWVGTVLRVEGYRGLVHYEGVPDEFPARWMDLATADVHPVGWCATQGRPLIPPPALAHRQQDWGHLLVKRLTGARTLPSNHHHKVLRSLSSCLREDHIVEVVDKSCVSQVRAAAVRQVIGRRLHVRYLDAPDDDGGFWCHEASPLVHPVGWAASVGHRISAPADYLARCQSGNYLPNDVTEHWAPPPATNADGFTVGMKLEALDPLNVSSFGVATVHQVLGSGYLMVRLETLPSDPSQPGRDWFCYHSSSPYILPARFCQVAGVQLTPPHGYTSESFSWQRYLGDTGSIVAPEHLFARAEVQHGFAPGQFLEAVDLLDPQLVCVATVSAVVGRLLRIHFTGWDSQYDQWVDVESPDIFPVGWCRMVGYKLEPPRAGDRQTAKGRARRRTGKKLVARKQRPSGGGGSKPPPPVAARLGSSNDSNGGSGGSVGSGGNGSVGGGGNGVGGGVMTKEVSVSPAALVPDLTAPISTDVGADTNTTSTNSQPAISDTTDPKPNRNNPAAAEPTTLPQIPRLLEPNPGPAGEVDPASWSVQDVSEFLRVNECAAYCGSFLSAGVDGNQLLSLTKDQVLELAGWKVGPSLKIENLVQKLRARVAPAQARFMASFKKV